MQIRQCFAPLFCLHLFWHGAVLVKCLDSNRRHAGRVSFGQILTGIKKAAEAALDSLRKAIA